MHPIPIALTCLAVLAVPVAAAPLPEPGAYEVAVRLELPHLDDATATRRLRRCLADAADPSAFAVLSENNPLARCPAANPVRASDALSFDIACPGRSAATAAARYEFAPGLVRGRIDMRMGGKNMTMTETQVWRRTGPCAPGEAPAP